jgi:tetratricopeptide (TPR) repeat protein
MDSSAFFKNRRVKSIIPVWALLIFSLLVVSCHQANRNKTGSQSTQAVAPTKLDTLNRQISSDSLNPEHYYLRSQYFLAEKDINKALSDINKAIQLNQKKADYFVTLSDIYMEMGRMPSCMEALKKAEELEPLNKNALLKLAEAYLVLKDYQNVFAYTKRTLDLDKLNPKAYFLRGFAYTELGDTALAIRNFQAATDQDQNYYDAYLELGALYSAQKNPLAAGYLETATRIAPGRGEAYYLLGLAYQEQENIPRAIETYEKLLKVSPDFKEADYNLGYVNLVYLKDFEAAVTYFSKAISIDPKYTDAYFNRGYSYELMGDYTKAKKDYEKALELFPNYERSILGLNRLDNLKP